MSVLDRFLGLAEEDRNEVVAILEHAKKLMENRFYDRASVEINKAFSLDEEIASELINELYQEMSGSNPDALISIGANLLQKNPDNLELANLLGNTYRKKGDWNQARNMYQHCLKRDPRNKNAAYNMAATIARVELYDGSAASAISEFENMSEYKLPDNSAGEKLLCRIQPETASYKNDKDEDDINEPLPDADEEITGKAAAEQLESEDAIMEEPPVVTAAQEAEDSGEGGEEKSALEIIDPAATFKYIINDVEPGSAKERQLCMALGLFCLSHHETGIAKRVFERLLRKQPNNPDFRCFLVLAFALRGVRANSIESLHGILAKNPYHRYTNVNLGYLYLRSGKTMKARTYFFITHKLLERTQGSYNLQDRLMQGEEQFSKGQKKKALEIYEPLVEEIRTPNLLNRTAQLQLENQELEEATRTFRRVLKISSTNNDAREGLKRVFQNYAVQVDNAMKKQDYETSARVLDKALDIYKTRKLLEIGVNIHTMLKNSNQVMKLERMLNKMIMKETEELVQEKIGLAEEAEKKGNHKAAIGFYEEAIHIDPRHSIMVKMSDFCKRINRPELAEKVADWYHRHVEEQKQLALQEMGDSTSEQ